MWFVRFVFVDVKVTIIDQKKGETWNLANWWRSSARNPPTIGTLQTDRRKVLTRLWTPMNLRSLAECLSVHVTIARWSFAASARHADTRLYNRHDWEKNTLRTREFLLANK